MAQEDKKAPDWLAIEGKYRAGVESVRAIADAHGISEAAIRKKAKAKGWLRDPSATKRAIVNAHFASSHDGSQGSQGGTQEGTQAALDNIAGAANEDIQDMERGLRINRLCLVNLEAAAAKAAEPKDIKLIVEATGAAIASIRKIRGLDTPTPTDAKDIDAAIEAELAQLERGRQAGAASEPQGA